MLVGAQLYTLRDYVQTEKDFARTMKKVADMGYTCVQISGAGPLAPKTFRDICDANGLKIVLTHTNPDRIVYETEKVIEEHDVMGCDYIGIGGMPGKYRDFEWYPYFAEDFKEAALKLRAAGKLLMYHNHNFEFMKDQNGVCLIDRLIEDFAADEMGFTLDTYWVQAGGADIMKMVKKLHGRLPCVHLKDMYVNGMGIVMAPVGEGNINFPALIPAFEEAGTKYMLVEQDTCQESPFICMKKSYDNLKKWGCK